MDRVFGWSSSQGHILTGGGELLECTTAEDYDESELPHYHLRNRSTRKYFSEWLSLGARSSLICGCWSRPVFAGGWQRDTDRETEAFNLQTPSFFIDMRFPVDRPTKRLCSRGQLSDCNSEDLKLLSRQHCFAGYSLPSVGKSGGLDADKPHFTRHHFIDWNYHPSFPRPRPNKWWVLMSPDKNHFKEYSFARDKRNVPVYFEQWTRRPDDNQGAKFLAARRETECPLVAAAQGRVPERDALLVIVGNHFALAIDRAQPPPAFAGLVGPAGSPLVDQSLEQGNLKDCAAYLDLEGSYGLVRQHTNAEDGKGAPAFIIAKSTHPWREGRLLGIAGARVLVDAWSGIPYGLDWNGAIWTLHENSFSLPELYELVSCPEGLRSRL